MSDYKEILYEKQRGGVLITLNRPEALNAITRSMLKELHQALDEAEADPEIRAGQCRDEPVGGARLRHRGTIDGKQRVGFAGDYCGPACP